VTDRSTVETVAIIGAGIGGLYLAGELGIAGFTLRLHDIDDSRLSEIRARGGVDIEGETVGFAAVDRATTDLPSAVDGADVIIVVTGGNTQAVVARSLAPLVRDGQVILLIQRCQGRKRRAATTAANGHRWKAATRCGAKINKNAIRIRRGGGAPYPTAVPLPPASVVW
jgi:ketopantoate reductase